MAETPEDQQAIDTRVIETVTKIINDRKLHATLTNEIFSIKDVPHVLDFTPDNSFFQVTSQYGSREEGLYSDYVLISGPSLGIGDGYYFAEVQLPVPGEFRLNNVRKLIPNTYTSINDHNEEPLSRINIDPQKNNVLFDPYVPDRRHELPRGDIKHYVAGKKKLVNPVS